MRPYRAPRHQHTPEMERGLELATGFTPGVMFVPHLVPAVRGVVTTAYAPLEPGVTTDALTSCLADAYRSRPFVRVLPPGGMVDSKRTRGSNVVELQTFADARTGTAVVIGALDNLVKGAAGSGDPEPEPDPRARRDHRAADAGGVPVSVTFPRGFRRRA